jgi:pilus assembly protein CpaB
MKKNILQLLGIAFVVAIAATGILYGLLAGKLKSIGSVASAQKVLVAARDLVPGTVITAKDVRLAPWANSEVPKGGFRDTEKAVGLTVFASILTGEPVTEARAASAGNGTGAALGIPAGMRAVSIHVSEASGVAAMLQPGHRVDVQVVSSKSAGNSDTMLRTFLQDVPVLSTNKGDGPQRSAPVITLLATPNDADLLALADAAASIRLVLRNPADRDRASMSTLQIPTLFPRPKALSPLLHASRPPSPLPEPDRYLRIQIAGVSVTALEELRSHLTGPSGGAAAFRPGWRAEDALQSLRDRRLLEVLSQSDQPAAGRGAWVEKASGQWRMRLHAAQTSSAGGSLRLRLRRDLSTPGSGGVVTHRYETEIGVADGQTLLLEDLAGGENATKIFPRHAGELIALITPYRAATDRASLDKER